MLLIIPMIWIVPIIVPAPVFIWNNYYASGQIEDRGIRQPIGFIRP